MKHVLFCALLVSPVLASSPASWAEDVWDQTGSEDSFTTENELAPGSSQVHDLEATGGVADQDWFRLSQKPYSSYEVLVDGTTAGMGNIPVTSPGDELAVDLMTGPTFAVPSGGLGASGAARVLYFRNESPTAVDDQQIRVSSPACNTACGANEQYTIHFFDTTYSVPRFNNSASQLTFLILQNRSHRTVYVNNFFFNGSGTFLGVYSHNIGAQSAAVLNTSTILGALAGQSGSIIVQNDGPHGALAGKAVALEPATGFTFDTQMVPRQ